MEKQSTMSVEEYNEMLKAMMDTVAEKIAEQNTPEALAFLAEVEQTKKEMDDLAVRWRTAREKKQRERQQEQREQQGKQNKS